MAKKAKKSPTVAVASGEDSKICSSCGYQKPLAEFPKVGAICKACKKIHHKRWRDKAYARTCSQCGRTKPPSDMQPQQHPDICKRCFQKRKSKRCRKCGEVKPLTPYFWPEAPEAADGFRGECLDCRARYDAAKYEKQRLDPQYRERKARNSKEWYAEHREYVSERDKKNERNLRFNNVVANATPIAERLIQSLLNRTNDGAASGIRQTRSILQRKAAYAARLVGLLPLGKNLSMVF